MSYQLEIAEPIDVGVRRIANELIDDAIARIEAAGRDRHEAVHEVRKNCKKVRGLLRLIRPQVPHLYDDQGTNLVELRGGGTCVLPPPGRYAVLDDLDGLRTAQS